MSHEALESPAALIGSRSGSGPGAVFTKPWVAEFILDLAGYTPDIDLASCIAVEPAVGHGAFLVPMVLRLLRSTRIHRSNISDAGGAILGFDIDPEAVDISRRAVRNALHEEGVPIAIATELSMQWVRQGDFLKVASSLQKVQWAIGNPPYVRVEEIDRETMLDYRKLWPTMTGRADLYVGFLEAGLSILGEGGLLAFICADRWMRNQYGAALRRKVENGYSVDASIVMHDVHAFEEKVDAYPAITLIRNGGQEAALVCTASADFDGDSARHLLRAWERGPSAIKSHPMYQMSWTTGWFGGYPSWPDTDPIRLAVLTELESRLPPLEETGAKVSVGVATGADGVYITDKPEGIEPDRLLKTISARETSSGEIAWTGKYLVNPWLDNELLPLSDRPCMAAYLRRHAIKLKARHIAKKNPEKWWRTIDRVDAAVLGTPKLLVPDLKDRISPVLDRGKYYPGHSLYYITSESWDLEVLGGLLLSDLASLFVESYSVRMANGYMRVSAQYLRRVRVPRPESLRPDTRDALRQAFRQRDIDSVNAAARVAYGVI